MGQLKPLELIRFAERADRRCTRAALWLPGFPAFGARNEDLAALMAPAAGADCYVLHYPGLGLRGGSFSFSAAIESAQAALKNLLEQHELVALVGHSFGGWLALQLGHAHRAPASITLLSPLLELPDRAAREQIIREFVLEQQKRGLPAGGAALLKDMQVLDRHETTQVAAQSVLAAGTPLNLIQAAEDEVTPTEISRSWANAMPRSLNYFETPGDHWWTGRREALARHLAELPLFGAVGARQPTPG